MGYSYGIYAFNGIFQALFTLQFAVLGSKVYNYRGNTALKTS